MTTLIYFAYGSNMSTCRLRARTPSARVLSTARLHQHSLVFHKESLDGSSKCHIEHTQNPDDIVHGVIYQLQLAEKPGLDKVEGLGKGYDEKQVPVIVPSGHEIIACTYYATHINRSLKPYHWYKEHVLRGAREHGLPDSYIENIESVISVADPDQDNQLKELSIYSGSIEKTSF
jgi:gamma-glutamylcyclotransferase